MTRLTFLLFVIIVLGCKPNDEKSDLIIGAWLLVSVFDFETQEISRVPNGEKLIAEFKSDSLYLRSIDSHTEYDVDIYAWQIKGDSIIFDNVYTGYIRELTTKSLIVDVDIFDTQRYSLIRIK
ncbi:MAG: hypothetical protein ACI9OE_001203 [Mariniflexile sp.]|jgi:hypothetical protein